MTADSSALRFDYFRTIWSLRFFWFSLVYNDIRSRYRRSILGVGWSLLRPMGMTAIFCLVFGTIFNRNIYEYAPYVLLGMTVWQFITESLNQGCHCFTIGSSYIRQQKIPHAIFPLRTVLGAGFHFLVALSLGILVTAFLHGIPNPALLLFIPVALILLAILGWSLAIIAGVSQTYFPDTSHLLEIGLQITFYLTPIMYSFDDFPNRARLTAVMAYNPINSILELFRRPLMKGELPPVENLLISLGFVALTTTIAWLLLRRQEKTLVFWL